MNKTQAEGDHDFQYVLQFFQNTYYVIIWTI